MNAKADQPLAVGERWYVRFPESKRIETVIVDELTERTVQLEIPERCLPGRVVFKVRYELRQVRFIERVL